MEGNQLQIDINLSSNLSIGNSFTLYLKDEIDANFNVIATIVERRLGTKQVELGANVNETINNLSQALKLDYGSYFDITKIGTDSGVKLKAKKPGWGYVNAITTPSELPIIFIPEVVPVSEFKINSVEFLTNEEKPCERVKVRITTNQPVANYCVNQTCWQLNSNIIEFWHYRGSTFRLDLTNYIGTHISTNIQTPPPLETATDKIRLAIFNGVSGGSVNVIHPYTTMLTYEFSLDNENWQTSNGFYGLLEGSYTLYVRDQYGCSKTIGFHILQENLGESFVFISKENSFRFIEPMENYQNDENRTFCKSPAVLNYGYIQEFLNTDVITTQFRSNYNEIEVKIYEVGSENGVYLPLNKRTSNIGNKVKYNQVKKYKINESQFGIYFESGQVLDYDNNSMIDTYELNGSLPVWAKLGNIISIDSIKYRIETIGFDENVNSEVLIFSGNELIAIQDVVVSSEYNLQNYEVYEFTVDFSFFQEKELYIEIKNSDPNYGEYIWRSEIIESKENLPDYLEVIYYNSTNTNIMYSTGIKHLLRVPYNTIKANDSDTSESYNTDTNTHLLDSKIYEVTDFEFMPFPLELYRKLKIALSLDNVFIDEVGYTKNTEFNKENLGSSNLYKLTASMIKNGFVFSSSQNANESVIENPNINVPGLIQFTSNGFIEL